MSSGSSCWRRSTRTCTPTTLPAAWLLKERCGSKIAIGAASNASGADRYLVHGDRVHFGDRYLEVRATPGHTQGCITFVLDDESIAFTGDCLLIRGSGRTDFQQGDARAMYRSVRSQILALPPSCLLYPAHDYRGLTVTSVEEERRFNPRLGGEIGEGDFLGYMNNLGLPHPKLMDIAVPANLRCGRPEGAAPLPAEPVMGTADLHVRRHFRNTTASTRGMRGVDSDRRRPRAQRIRRTARSDT